MQDEQDEELNGQTPVADDDNVDEMGNGAGTDGVTTGDDEEDKDDDEVGEAAA